MTAVVDVPSSSDIRLTTGAQAALITVVVGAICLALEGVAPWLVKWPTTWEVPATQWVGAFLDWFLNGIKPAMRLFSDLMAYPMNWANFVLGSTPWPILIGLVTALGWFLGGLPMAALGFFGLCFVLASGYWAESMNTLALVAVSVPVALIVGGAIGILANEVPRV